MDAKLVLAALNGTFPIEELSVAERLALARAEAVRVKARPPAVLPARFLVPRVLENIYRNRPR